MNNTFENRDCIEGMKECPDGHFDLAIVDPEYGINASKKHKYHRNAMTKYKPKNWDTKIPSKKYFKELFRVSKEQIIWGGNYFVKHLIPAKNWIVWDKKQPNGVSFSMHELAFYSGAGQAKIFSQLHCGNRVSNSPDKAQKYLKIHPTQKPVALYLWLLNNYAKPGDLILDTHVGSASSLIACEKLGFNYVGYELDKDYYKAACDRLNEFRLQVDMFIDKPEPVVEQEKLEL